METIPTSTPAPVATAEPRAEAVATPTIIAAMLRAAKHVSDLIFSPGRPPQVEATGQLIEVVIPDVGKLTPEDTARIAADLIGGSAQAVEKLRTQGSCDISYSLARLARFRVNIFTQRGSCAIVMRVIPNRVPTFGSLNLPPQLKDIMAVRNGIVLVTGPTGSGKSSTLAAIIDLINDEKAFHIITIEDPIEFLHNHKKCTIHQREVHSDTPSFALALRAALRQAPKVILVGEMRDKETIEIALEAAETGHLVLSTLAHDRRFKDCRTHRRRFSAGRPAYYSHTSFQGVPIHRFAAIGATQRWRWTRGGNRNSEIHDAHAGLRGKRRVRRQEFAGRDARRRD